MQAWGKMLSETDIAAALTYTRNAFGNNTGDVVQPKTIAQIKTATTRLTFANSAAAIAPTNSGAALPMAMPAIIAIAIQTDRYFSKTLTLKLLFCPRPLLGTF